MTSVKRDSPGCILSIGVRAIFFRVGGLKEICLNKVAHHRLCDVMLIFLLKTSEQHIALNREPQD